MAPSMAPTVPASPFPRHRTVSCERGQHISAPVRFEKRVLVVPAAGRQPDLARMPALQALAGLAPPNLVLINADGQVLANGWQGRRYEGLQPVLKEWTKRACAQEQARCPPGL